MNRSSRIQWDRVFLLAAYVILVAVVAFEAWWINQEFDDARAERCALALLEVEVTRLHLTAESIDVVPDRQAALDLLEELAGLIEDECDEIVGV